MQPIQLTPFQALWRSILLVIQAAPIELRNLVFLNLIGGAGPAAVLFLNKIAIDEVSRLLGTHATTNIIALVLSQPRLVWSIVGIIILNLLVDSIGTVSVFEMNSLRDRTQGYVQGQVLSKVANFADIALFETPELLNIVQLSENALQRLKQLASILSSTLTGLFAFVPSVSFSATIAWWVPLLMIVSAAPSIYVQMRYQRYSWRVEKTQASTVREMNLYARVLTGEEYAKEIRLFRLQSLLLERWQGLFGQFFKAMLQVRRQGTLAVLVLSLLSGLGSALPYVYVVIGVLRGSYTLGDLALYAGLILQVRRSLSILIGNSASLYDIALGVSPIFQLLELKPQMEASARVQVTSRKSQVQLRLAKTGIEIKDLCFSYPGGDRQILEDINLTIRPNEMVALVGENGAGKTTLAKLLCRLYDPTSGAIEWNGRDLRSLDLDTLRDRIAVVMQDYARFPATVRENVAFGSLPQLQDDSVIMTAISEAGIAKVVEYLSQGLDTPLGKQLEGGVDFSGGQWQRIAIARALMRLSQAELLVFDEPTAALDPKTEHEIYNIFRTIATGRMAVVISHRLALAKIADRIVVLENGKILETGTHNELMLLQGRYYSMFSRQASSYL